MEAHKTATRTKSSGFSPETIKREIASLEEDKAQLSTKVARVRRRVSSMPNFEHELGIGTSGVCAVVGGRAFLLAHETICAG